MGDVVRLPRAWEGPDVRPIERPVTKQEMASLVCRTPKFLDRKIRAGMPERKPGSDEGCWQRVGGGKVFFPSAVFDWLSSARTH